MLPSHEEIQKIFRIGRQQLDTNPNSVYRHYTIDHRNYIMFVYWKSGIDLKQFNKNYNLSYNILRNWKVAIRKGQHGVEEPWNNHNTSAITSKNLHYNEDVIVPKSWNEYAINQSPLTKPELELEPEPEPEVSMQSFTLGDQLREELFDQLTAEYQEAEQTCIALRHKMTMLSEQWDSPTL